jgi:hypothetical protein
MTSPTTNERIDVHAARRAAGLLQPGRRLVVALVVVAALAPFGLNEFKVGLIALGLA